jgi:hypothetical protein
MPYLYVYYENQNGSFKKIYLFKVERLAEFFRKFTDNSVWDLATVQYIVQYVSISFFCIFWGEKPFTYNTNKLLLNFYFSQEKID